MISLEVSGLGFRYEKSPAWSIRNLDFMTYEGTITAITGSNGSGKTTLLRCISGLAPELYRGEIEGEIRLLGKNLKDMKRGDIIKLLGMVFQNPETQLFLSTVQDELTFGPENLCVTRDEIKERLERILGLVGIGHLRHENPSRLSGGEQQLVAIASVLMMEPRILLLDEVTSWVDVKGQDRIRGLLLELSDSGHTIVMVDHSKENILLADQIIEIRK
ncbi:MAG: energy-coupling factor ABC transporter ATP-binding protein [Gudongella sp.]|nr:energy-coupling factor ABC transporter ATP-binding protein [Gudongella sp.]